MSDIQMHLQASRLSHAFSELDTSDMVLEGDASPQLGGSVGVSGRSTPRTPRAHSLLSSMIARSHSTATSPTRQHSHDVLRHSSSSGLQSDSCQTLDRGSRGSGDSSSPLQRCSSSIVSRASVPIPIPETTYLVNPAHIEQRARLQQLRVWHRLQMQPECPAENTNSN